MERTMNLRLAWATPDADILIRYSGDPATAALYVAARLEFMPGTAANLGLLRIHFDRTVPAVDLHRNCVLSFQRAEQGFIYATASIASWAAYVEGEHSYCHPIDTIMADALPWAWPHLLGREK